MVGAIRFHHMHFFFFSMGRDFLVGTAFTSRRAQKEQQGGASV